MFPYKKNRINKMLRGRIDRIIITILSILPRSILFILLKAVV